MAHRRALITGATSGIGAAFARELPTDTDLLLTRRRADRLQALPPSWRGPGRRVETVTADLADPAGCALVAERARAAGTRGGITILSSTAAARRPPERVACEGPRRARPARGALRRQALARPAGAAGPQPRVEGLVRAGPRRG